MPSPPSHPSSVISPSMMFKCPASKQAFLFEAQQISCFILIDAHPSLLQYCAWFRMAGFFYYVTYKYVLLKDARLGVLYYLLAALIVLYTVVEIFVRKGYMQVSLLKNRCG